MPTKTIILVSISFMLPIGIVLWLDKDTILDDMTPRPENGRMVYITTNR